MEADQPDKRIGRRIYDESVREVLIVVWETADRICGKRLKAVLPSLVESMERHGHLRLEDEVRRHCGGSMAGSFVHTFTVTDIASGWTEGMPLLVREQGLVTEALDAFRARLPVALRGLTRRYFPPATPCERLLACTDVSEETKERLRRLRTDLDPVELLKKLRDAQAELAELTSGGSEQARAVSGAYTSGKALLI